MKLDCIKQVLQHCYERQMDTGPESAVRFALILGPLRNQIPATYPGASNTSPPPDRVALRSKGKGKERQVQQLENLIRVSECPTFRSNTGSEPPDSPIPTEDINSFEDHGGMDPGDGTAVPPVAGPSNQTRLGRATPLPTLIGPPNRASLRPYPRPRPIINHRADNPILQTMGEDVTVPAEVVDETRIGHNETQIGQTTPVLTSIGPINRPSLSPEPAELVESSCIPSAPFVDETERLDVSPSLRCDDPKSPQAETLNVENDTTDWVDEAGPSTPVQRRKRPTILLSPPSPRVTRSKQRRKITNDDLAAIEAQSLLVVGRRSRRIRRRS